MTLGSFAVLGQILNIWSNSSGRSTAEDTVGSKHGSKTREAIAVVNLSTIFLWIKDTHRRQANLSNKHCLLCPLNKAIAVVENLGQGCQTDAVDLLDIPFDEEDHVQSRTNVGVRTQNGLRSIVWRESEP